MTMSTPSLFAHGHKHSENTSKPKSKKKSTLNPKLKSAVNDYLKKHEAVHNTLMKPVDKTNLVKLINAAQGQLKIAQKNVRTEEDASTALSKMIDDYGIMAQQTGKGQALAFADVNQSLMKLLNRYQIDDSFHLFYCPMVKRGWADKGTAIRNPFDPSMPGCGRLVK